MARRAPLGRTVWALGLTSLFTDVGTEMIFPLLPLFLTQLGAGATALGLIEGTADAVAALLKLCSGWLVDRWPRAKELAIFGYSLSTVARPLVALATLPGHVFAIRIADRVGKGVRGSARDALLAGGAPPGEAGRAFGFDRSMDHLGALTGPLLASGLLAMTGQKLRLVFGVALVPGLVAVSCLAFGVPNRGGSPISAPPEPNPPSLRGRGGLAPLPARFWLYVAISGLFALASSSDAFLLLRAGELGVAATALPIVWALLHLSKTVSSYPLGSLSDRIGRFPALLAGLVWYAASYLGFASAHRAAEVWLLFAAYGVFYGLTEGVGKALVSDLVAKERRGSGFGVYNGVTGLFALPAGLLTGALWHRFGSGVALEVDAALAFASALLLGGLWAASGRGGRPVSAG